MCKFRLNNEELPNITALVSKLDGKGRNEIIRLFMRLALNNISYPIYFEAFSPVNLTSSILFLIDKMEIYNQLFKYI